MTKLASHNSWSFMTPLNQVLRPFLFMARCQDLNIKDQYYRGVRCFDLRVRFDDGGSPYICHGLMRYIGSPYEQLYILDHLAHLTSDKVYCRVMLEDNMFTRDRAKQELNFGAFCCRLDHNIGLKQITFFGGWTKHGWRNRQIYTFRSGEPSIMERHASVTGNKLARALQSLCPVSFARKHNKEIKEEECPMDYLMIDFIEL